MIALRSASRGFTLIELLVALAIGAVLTTGILRLAQGVKGSHRLQNNLGQLQEDARFALQMIARDVAHAGFRPRPWDPETAIPAVGGNSVDGFTAFSDRLVLRRWSARNCFGNRNPVEHAGGAPDFYLLESEFLVTESGNLVQTCRFGPDAGSLVTQINRLGLIRHAGALQVLFAEDSDGDGHADRWVRTGDWLQEPNVLAVKVGLLLASPERLVPRAPALVQVLDEAVPAPPDGRLRRAFTRVVAIAGRSG